MKILAISSFFSWLLILTVFVPSVFVLNGRVSYLQDKAVKSGAAQWVPNEDDPKILELQFKNN